MPKHLVSILSVAMFAAFWIPSVHALDLTLFSADAPLNTNAAVDSGADGGSVSNDIVEGPQLATGGSGVWIAVWQASDFAGADFDILYARSLDNGATWSAPAALNTNAGSDSGDDKTPRIATDGAGNWVVVWYSKDTLGGTKGADEDILVSRSANDGVNWSAPAVLNSSGFTDSGKDVQPKIVTDRNGLWVCIWQSNDPAGIGKGTDYDILISRSTNNGANWSSVAALNTNATTDLGNDVEPQLATDTQGHWVCVWQSNSTLGSLGNDFDILVSRSANNSTTWTAPAALNSNAAVDQNTDSDGIPKIVTDEQGHWIVVWTYFVGTTTFQGRTSRSNDNGATWTAVAALPPGSFFNSGSTSDLYPDLATDKAGHWILVWQSGPLTSDFDIMISQSSTSGITWTAAKPLSPAYLSNSGRDILPQIVTDGLGHWISVWASADSLGGTIGTDLDVLFSAADFGDPNAPAPNGVSQQLWEWLD